MALGMVQAGYGKSLYAYTAGFRPELECSYAELLAELTTELELALENGTDEEISDSEKETGDREDFEQAETYSRRKEEWEELLEKSLVVEAMLRQMLENGLGQSKEEEQQKPKKKQEEELDNSFDLADGVPAAAEGKHKNDSEYSELTGNSQFLQKNTGGGSEYFSPSGGERKYMVHPGILCLTCQTECDKKKNWKITK